MKELFFALLILFAPHYALSMNVKNSKAEILNAFYYFHTKAIEVKLRYKQANQNPNFKLKIKKCSQEFPLVCNAIISYDEPLDEKEGDYTIKIETFLIPENLIPSFIKLKSTNNTTYFIPVSSSSLF